MITINWWCFINLYNVKALTGKRKTHTNDDMGWFSPELTLTIMPGDFHPNSQSTITLGDFHLGTTWPPLLSGLRSPRVSIPGVWVIFAKTWIWSMQRSAPHRWQLAPGLWKRLFRQPLPLQHLSLPLPQIPLPPTMNEKTPIDLSRLGLLWRTPWMLLKGRSAPVIIAEALNDPDYLKTTQV